MALPEFSMRQLLEAGVHFGHQTHRWNPKMSRYIYGSRNGIHIINLTETVPLLDAALNALRECVAKGGRILFVGTKRQAQEPIKDAAERSAQHFMNHRWLGGTLTNWKTISRSISRLRQLDELMESGEAQGFTKKERLNLERERGKLQASLGGIREMGGVPDMLFAIDTNKEDLAIAEARKLGIPVVAVLDTNSDPAGVDYPIPGNDDASRAIALYCDLAARAVIDGMASQLDAAGFDLGEMEDVPLADALGTDPGAADDPVPGDASVDGVGESVTAEEAAESAPAEEPAAEGTRVEEPTAEDTPTEETAESAPAEEPTAEDTLTEETAESAPAEEPTAEDTLTEETAESAPTEEPATESTPVDEPAAESAHLDEDALSSAEVASSGASREALGEKVRTEVWVEIETAGKLSPVTVLARTPGDDVTAGDARWITKSSVEQANGTFSEPAKGRIALFVPEHFLTTRKGWEDALESDPDSILKRVEKEVPE